MSISNLDRFLKARKADENFTHISMLGEFGKYNIQAEDEDDFYRLYGEEILAGRPVGLGERQDHFSPILCDIDIRVQVPKTSLDTDRIYKEEHVAKVVKIYQEFLKSSVKPAASYTQNDVGLCIVLEKTKSVIERKDDSTFKKGGFHLHFPNAYFEKAMHSEYIFPNIRKEIKEQKLFADILPAGKCSSSVFDEASARVNWLMYGSKKSATSESYRITGVYGSDYEKVDVDEFIEKNGGEKGIVRYMSLSSIGKKTCVLDLTKTNMRVLDLKKIEEDNLRALRDERREASDENDDIDDLGENMEQIQAIVDCIKPTRADVYKSWIAIGKSLYEVSKGSEKAFDIWDTFSQKTSLPNYTLASCQYNWSKFSLGYYSVSTLIYYAREDNPVMYNKLILGKKDKKLLKSSIEGGHLDFAWLIFRKYKDMYVCTNPNDNWYKFSNNGWSICYEKNAIYQHVRSLDKLYDDFYIRTNVKNVENEMKLVDLEGEEDADAEEIDKMRQVLENKKAKYNLRLRKIQKTRINLKTTNFTSDIAKQCRSIFFKDNFTDRLDKDIHLVRFNNGVLDVRSGFRLGLPEDFLSLNTGYDYIDYDKEPMNQDALNIINEHFRKVYPKDHVRKYFMQYCGNLLLGGNNQKTLLILSGCGANAKTINIKIMQNSLGGYAYTFPTTVLTGKRGQSGGATPELANLGGIRFAIVQEPSKKDTINTGMLKELTGNDLMYVRCLYRDRTSFIPMFKLAIICNDKPEISHEDQAVWDRVLDLKHLSRFLKPGHPDLPLDLEEQKEKMIFQQDPMFSEKLDSIKQVFMYLMFKSYRDLAVNHNGIIPIPAEIIEDTEIYRNSQDYILNYIYERIHLPKQGDNLDDFVLPEETILGDFKFWSKDKLNVTVSTGKDLNSALKDKWRSNKSIYYNEDLRTWFGVKLLGEK